MKFSIKKNFINKKIYEFQKAKTLYILKNQKFIYCL